MLPKQSTTITPYKLYDLRTVEQVHSYYASHGLTQKEIDVLYSQMRTLDTYERATSKDREEIKSYLDEISVGFSNI